MTRSCSYAKAHRGAVLAGLAVLLAAAALPAWGQSSWPNYPNNSAIAVTSGGYVGIGTANPVFNLHTRGIIAADQGSNVMVLLGQTAGAAGAGTSYGGIWYDTASNSLRIDALSGGVAWRNIVLNGNGAGNVGIGTTNPQHLLHVAGTIGAEEVLVTSTGADYVFEPGYRLQPLSEIAKYIEANHHLPDIPSADEVKRKGMGVGQMEAKLLAKVEELTLHMISAEERNNQLAQRNDRLEQMNRDLQERFARLEAQYAH